jgi:hypothetical protein
MMGWFFQNPFHMYINKLYSVHCTLYRVQKIKDRAKVTLINTAMAINDPHARSGLTLYCTYILYTLYKVQVNKG